MFAVTAATGRVGGAAASTLVDQGKAVRIIARDAGKAQPWADRGCEITLATMEDQEALTKAFSGCEGVMLVVPPSLDQPEDLPKARAIVAAYRAAIMAARPGKVVALSSVGAQATQRNTISELTILERQLADVDLPITFLRPAWYIENAEWDVSSATNEGVILSFLQPVDRKLPMVSVADAGRTAGELLMETWTGHRIVELHGPGLVSPQDIARAFGKALGRHVGVEAVPHAAWEGIFRQQGIKDPEMWMKCIDGFNEGWLTFEGTGTIKRIGRVGVEEAVAAIVGRNHDAEAQA